jgi:hypothetical protein
MQYSQQVLKGNDLYLSNLEMSAKLITKKADAFKSVLIDKQAPFRDARTSNDIENDKIGRLKEFNFIASIILRHNYGQMGQLEKILNENNIMLYFLKNSPKIIKEAKMMLQPNFQDIFYITRKLYNADNDALNTLYLREETKNYRDYIIYLMRQIIELLKQNRGQIIDGTPVDNKIDDMEDFISRLSYSNNPESFIKTNTGKNVNEFMSELMEQIDDNEEETNDLVNQMSELLGDDNETNEELNEDYQQNTIIEPEQNEWEETKDDIPTYTQDNPPPPPPPRVNQQNPPPPPPPPLPRRKIDEEDDYLREQLEKDQQEMTNIRNNNQPSAPNSLLSQIQNQNTQLKPVDRSNMQTYEKPKNPQQLLMSQIKDGINLNIVPKKVDLPPQLEPPKKNELANKMAEQFDNFANKLSTIKVPERNQAIFEDNDDDWDQPEQNIKIPPPQIQKPPPPPPKVNPPSRVNPPPSEVKQPPKETNKPPTTAKDQILQRRQAIKGNDDNDDDDNDDDNDDDWMSGAGFGNKKIKALTYQELRSILSVLGLPNSRGLKKFQLQKILKGYKNKK